MCFWRLEDLYGNSCTKTDLNVVYFLEQYILKYMYFLFFGGDAYC